MENLLCYDVVIVGAGPGGLKCAEVLGNSGLQVLVLEKNEEIGPKVCAGGLTGKDIEYLNLPKELIEYTYNRVSLFVYGWKKVIRNAENYAYTIDRRQFGQWQLSKLSAYPNVEVRTGCKVSNITKDTVLVNGESIGYKILVGADGSNSTVRRYLQLPTKEVGVAVQYIIPTDEYKEMELHFGSRMFGIWYAWIFPHKGYVSVGCGTNPSVLPASVMKKNFHRWLKKRGIDVSEAIFEGFPIMYDYQGYQFDNIYLVGDAAGFVSGFTGEGIYQAMVTGEEVGKQILDPAYQPQKMERIFRIMHSHNRIIDMLVKAGWYRDLLFAAGMILFSFEKFKLKMIRVLG